MTKIRIAAVGDLLMWHRQIAAAKIPGKNGYSFDKMFQHVAPYLRRADLTIGNLETTLSGREAQYQKRNPTTTWPMFNCPDELAPALKRAGIDVLTTANNHCMDRGLAGLFRTLTVLDRYGFAHTGTNKSREDAKRLLVCDVQGIRVGILAYTYGTNRIPVPDAKAWAVNRIRPAKIKADIARMRRVSELVIVALHFGQEFHRFPNEKQKSLVQQVFEAGADVVLGCHPHVLQPMFMVKKKPPVRGTKDKFVIYSLGNFISDRMLGSLHADSGAIVLLDIEKSAAGAVRIVRAEAIPTWVHKWNQNGRTEFRVLPVRPFLKKPDRFLTPKDLDTMKKVLSNTTRHLALRSRAD